MTGLLALRAAAADKLELVPGPVPMLPDTAKWALRGVTSNTRYTASVESIHGLRETGRGGDHALRWRGPGGGEARGQSENS